MRFDNDGFKNTARDLSVAVVITDPEGQITWANRAFKALCGYTLKECMGKRPGCFLQGPGTDPSTVEALHCAMEEQRHITVEVLNYHKNGHPYWAKISISPCFDKEGRLEGHIGLAQDVSEKRIELKRMESDLVGVYRALVNECSQATEGKLDEDPFKGIAGDR